MSDGERVNNGPAKSRRANDGRLEARLERLPVHPGLCAGCRHLQLLASRRSVFARCGRAAEDPRFPRYPPLPVRTCAGYEAAPTH